MACTGAIAALVSAVTLVSAETVVIGTEVPFPPYTSYDAEGEIVGFERDIGDEVCRRAGLACSWQAAQFDTLLPGVQSGLYDIAMAGIAITPERLKIVDFSVPYENGEDTTWFLGRPGAPEPDRARVGVQSGTIFEDHLRATGRSFARFGTEDEMLDALVAGRVDLAFGAFTGNRAGRLVAEAGFDWLWSEEVPDLGLAMAVCKGNDALLQRVDAALTGMLSDGTIDEIAARWMM